MEMRPSATFAVSEVPESHDSPVRPAIGPFLGLGAGAADGGYGRVRLRRGSDMVDA